MLDDEAILNILKNVRRIKSKAWNKRNPNWVVVKVILGKGSGSSQSLCRLIGVDPDGFEFKKKVGEV